MKHQATVSCIFLITTRMSTLKSLYQRQNTYVLVDSEYGSSNAVSDVGYHKTLYHNSENHIHSLFVVNYHECEDEH